MLSNSIAIINHPKRLPHKQQEYEIQTSCPINILLINKVKDYSSKHGFRRGDEFIDNGQDSLTDILKLGIIQQILICLISEEVERHFIPPC
jgi:hypothetical protein